jgi:hypothetical protein
MFGRAKDGALGSKLTHSPHACRSERHQGLLRAMANHGGHMWDVALPRWSMLVPEAFGFG